MVAKFRMPIKRSLKSDPQQYLLYRMEQECFGGMWRGRMTLKAIRSLSDSICKNYGVEKAKVSFKELGKWAGQCLSTGAIEINPNKRAALSMICILHELAHHIHNQLVPFEVLVKQEFHGPEFLACYMSVLDTTRVIPLAGMRAILKGYDLMYIDPGDDCSVSVLKERISQLPR